MLRKGNLLRDKRKATSNKREEIKRSLNKTKRSWSVLEKKNMTPTRKNPTKDDEKRRVRWPLRN